MPAIYSVIDKCPVPVGAHLVKNHVRKGNASFDSTKSYFTDKEGNELAWEAAVQVLIKAKETIEGLATTKRDLIKSITNGTKTVYAITADTGKIGFAVTWGDKVGRDQSSDCKWVCLFVTSTLTASRHQWVTAFPATETYVNSKKLP